jgi:thiol-disulfide isomerase/thioredoxin
MAPACRGSILNQIDIRNVAVLLCGAGLWLAAASLSYAVELKSWTEPASPVVSRALALRALGGSAMDLNALRGKIVIVHFFATWCEPCREELPALQRLVARSGDQPVAVIAISVGEVELRVRRFFQSTPVDFPILLDQDQAVTKAWNISELPSTVVLDSDLRPRLAVEGDFAWDQLDLRALVEMLDPNHTKQNAQPIHEGGS